MVRGTERKKRGYISYPRKSYFKKRRNKNEIYWKRLHNPFHRYKHSYRTIPVKRYRHHRHNFWPLFNPLIKHIEDDNIHEKFHPNENMNLAVDLFFDAYDIYDRLQQLREMRDRYVDRRRPPTPPPGWPRGDDDEDIDPPSRYRYNPDFFVPDTPPRIEIDDDTIIPGTPPKSKRLRKLKKLTGNRKYRRAKSVKRTYNVRAGPKEEPTYFYSVDSYGNSVKVYHDEVHGKRYNDDLYHMLKPEQLYNVFGDIVQEGVSSVAESLKRIDAVIDFVKDHSNDFDKTVVKASVAVQSLLYYKRNYQSYKDDKNHLLAKYMSQDFINTLAPVISLVLNNPSKALLSVIPESVIKGSKHLADTDELVDETEATHVGGNLLSGMASMLFSGPDVKLKTNEDKAEKILEDHHKITRDIHSSLSYKEAYNSGTDIININHQKAVVNNQQRVVNPPPVFNPPPVVTDPPPVVTDPLYPNGIPSYYNYYNNNRLETGNWRNGQWVPNVNGSVIRYARVAYNTNTGQWDVFGYNDNGQGG